MIKIKFNLLLIILIPLFLYSCASAKSALQGEKRSEQSDEFLVKKKNPLTMPPDFEKLPLPGNQTISQQEVIDNSDIKNLLKVGKEDKNLKQKCNPETTDCKKSSIESSIIKKIQ